MSSFSKFLVESSFARVYQHTQDRNIGMISASRGNLTSEENNKRFSSLKSDVRKAGYGYVHVKGRYIENYGTPQARPVDEKSLLVIGKKGGDKGALLGHMKALGSKYNQDSILHKPHDSETASLHGTSDSETAWPKKGETHDVGKWHPNKAGEFHSLLKGKPSKPMAFEEFVFTNEPSFFTRKETLY